MYEETQSNDDFITRYAPLVQRIAYHLKARLPESVMIEDLLQSGMMGLLEAASKYNESKGASFETYAGIRIRGAMIDEIRKGDWVPRSVHDKANEIAQAKQELQQMLGREPSNEELSIHMDISLAHL